MGQLPARLRVSRLLATATVCLALLAVAQMPAAPVQAQTKFKICKWMVGFAIHRHRSLAYSKAFQRFQNKRAGYRAGGYAIQDYPIPSRPTCVSKRNGFHCRLAARVCKRV